MSKSLLKAGFLIDIHHKDKENDIVKHTYVLDGKWLKKLNIYKNISENDFYDVVLKKKINLDKFNVLMVEYPYCPKGVNVFDVYSDKDFSLDNHKTYIKELKKEILHIKNILKDIRKEHFLNFKKLTKKDAYDFYILRFYPKKIKKDQNVLKEIKKDILQKFFISKVDSNYDEGNMEYKLSTIEALKMFGVLKRNENTADIEFINCLKRKWYQLIETQKKDILNNIKKTDISFLSQNEKKEFDLEYNEYKKELNQITKNCLDDFKTPKDIVSYWPIALQPQPCFVNNEKFYGN